MRGSPVSTPSTRRMPVSPIKRVGRRLEHVPHRGRGDGTAPVGHHGDPHAAEGLAERAEPGLVALDARQAQRVARVVAVADVEPPGGVAHRPRQTPDRDGQVAVLHVRRQRDAAVGGLQPDEAAEAGRDADRATAVAGGGQREDAAGHRGGRAARRPARGAVELPRVVGRAVEQRAGEVDAPELGRRGLAGEHGTADVADALHHRRGRRGDAVGQRHRRRRVRANRRRRPAP